MGFREESGSLNYRRQGNARRDWFRHQRSRWLARPTHSEPSRYIRSSLAGFQTSFEFFPYVVDREFSEIIGFNTLKQHLLELALGPGPLIRADQVADVFACGAVFVLLDALIDVGLHRLRQRDVHRSSTHGHLRQLEFGHKWQKLSISAKQPISLT